MLSSTTVLEQIQKIDLEISSIQEEKKKQVAGIDGLSVELDRDSVALKAISDELETLKQQKKDIEEKLRAGEEKVKTDEKKLGGVKNEKEFNALSKEISSANKNKKAGELELASLAKLLAEKESLFKEKDAAISEKKARLENLRKELESNETSWSEALVSKTQMRDSLVPNVRPDVFRSYESIRSRRGGRGLVPVKDETCQGCFIHIPPQIYIQLKKGVDEIISCPHCHRILFFDNQKQPTPEAV